MQIYCHFFSLLLFELLSFCSFLSSSLFSVRSPSKRQSLIQCQYLLLVTDVDTSKTLVIFFKSLFICLFSSNSFLGVYPLCISGISAVSQQSSSLDLYFFLLNELVDYFVVPSQRWEGKGTIKSFSLAKVLSCFHKDCMAPNYTSGYIHENLLKVAKLCMSHKATGAAVGEKKKECVSCVCLKHLLMRISLNLRVVVLVHFQSPLLPLCSVKVITGRRGSQ